MLSVVCRYVSLSTLPHVTASAGGQEESDPSVTGAVTICTSKW